MAENKLSSVSKADTLEKMGEFWDTHDFTDFDDPNTPDVEFDISCAVPIEEELFSFVAVLCISLALFLFKGTSTKKWLEKAFSKFLSK